MSTKEVRFAVMIDSTFLKKWQIDCIQKLTAINGVQLVAFFINDNAVNYQSSNNSIGYRFLDRLIRNKGPLEIQNTQSIFPQIPFVQLQAIKERYYIVLNQDDLNKVESYKLDFILRFGFGILKKEVLEIPKYGIWSFHHADPMKIRGGPTAFWDIYLKHSMNGAMLQRLTNDLDAGILLKSGYLKSSNHSFLENTTRILEISTDWPAQVVNKYLLNNAKNDFPNSAIKHKAKLYKTPNNFQVLRFLALLIINKIKFHWQQLFHAEIWNIGVAKEDISNFYNQQIKEVDWAPKPENKSYKADPFEKLDEKNAILFENFNYSNYKGEILQINYLENNWSKAKPFLKSNFHLSYPYTFKDGETSYLLVESHESNQLLLRCLNNGEETKLLEGQWLDPTLIQHGGKWWLFCNHKKAPNEQLYIFFSNAIKGPYTAHTLNPVLTDIRNSRPAGTPFVVYGKIYRPAQNCSKTYGGSIRIQEIKTLTETNYNEETVNELFPDQLSQYPSGIHSISSFGKYTLVDGKKCQFSLANFLVSLKRKLTRLS